MVSALVNAIKKSALASTLLSKAHVKSELLFLGALLEEVIEERGGGYFGEARADVDVLRPIALAAKAGRACSQGLADIF